MFTEKLFATSSPESIFFVQRSAGCGNCCRSDMADPRYKKLAEVLTGYSTALKKGDTVLFDVTDTPEAFCRGTRPRGPQARGHSSGRNPLRPRRPRDADEHQRANTPRTVPRHRVEPHEKVRRLRRCPRFPQRDGELRHPVRQSLNVLSHTAAGAQLSREQNPLGGDPLAKTARWPKGPA